MAVAAISNAVTKLRAKWALRFIDTAAIVRTTGRGTYNPATLKYDSPTTPTVYSGPALVRPGDSDTTVFGEANRTHHEFYVYLPHTATGVEPDDRATVTVPGDTDLNGKTLIVEQIYADAYIPRRKVGCRLDQGTGNP